MQSSILRRPSSVLLALLALPLLGLFASPRPAAAQTFAPPILLRQPPQTVITSLPYTITKPGLYVLNENLSSSLTSGNLITVNADNVTVDLQGHSLSGPANYSNEVVYGIYAEERGNATVRNGTISHCQYGVYLLGTLNASTTNNLNQVVDSLRVTHCVAGIVLNTAPGSRVTNCQVTQMDSDGIAISGPGGTVQGCVVNQVGGTGIQLGVGTFARQNSIANAYYGILEGKYQDNLTSGCTTPFAAGTDAGGNN